MIPETAYGMRKRLHTVAALIEEHGPQSVLDIGCGTGMLLLLPLAESFPGVRFCGVDEDASTISFARSQARVDNVELLLEGELDARRRFDLVIASEVIEHTEHPAEFLAACAGRLASNGKLFLTLPNGYGPFEIASFFQAAWNVVRRVGAGPRVTGDQGAPDTLAASPHVNFFGYGEIRRLTEATGFQIVDYRPRTFLCGFLLDGLVSRLGLEGWNARVADRLPGWMVSDWMFVLEHVIRVGTPPYRSGALSSLRARLNRRVAGVAH